MIVGPLLMVTGAALAALVVVSGAWALGLPAGIAAAAMLIGGWDVLVRSRRLRALRRRRSGARGWIL